MKLTATPEGATILVVEDSPTQAAHLRHILERHGYRAVVAGNGRDALDLLPGEKPSLVITDIIMPEMDGYELCSRIKAKCEDKEVPVILLTALNDPHDVIKGLTCGADNFITKPYQEGYLLARINYLLANRVQCRQGTADEGVEIIFDGRPYQVTADRRQILDLLLSTYETAIQKNKELLSARDELNRLNEQLATANRDLEAFNYTVSHDLRGPLTNIHGFCQVLLELCGHSLEAQTKDYILEIFKASQRMDLLITTLLRFAQLGRQELLRKEVDLSVLAQSVAVDLRYGEPQRTVRFTAKEGLSVEGDPVLLRAVLENLLGNAWKYTRKTAAPVVEFGVTDLAGERVFYVRDNGAGFDMDQAYRLFGAFERLHRKEEFEGTGVGLATVQRIIQRHGGRIWAEGEIDRGATFYFTLD